MSKKSWIPSLIFPVLSSVVSVVLPVLSIPYDIAFSEWAYTVILGLVCGGLVPLFMV